MMQWGNYGWGMGFGWLFMIIFWTLVILGVVYLGRTAVKSGKGPDLNKAALDILKKRYAQGEITKEELEKKKDDLMSS